MTLLAMARAGEDRARERGEGTGGAGATLLTTQYLLPSTYYLLLAAYVRPTATCLLRYHTYRLEYPTLVHGAGGLLTPYY